MIIVVFVIDACSTQYEVISAEDYANEISFATLTVYNTIKTDMMFPTAQNHKLAISIMELIKVKMLNKIILPKNAAQKKLLLNGQRFLAELQKHIDFLIPLSSILLTPEIIRQRERNSADMDAVAMETGTFIQENKIDILSN